METNFALNFGIALAIFVGHILANFVVTRPNPDTFKRFEKLTLFPPGWVFLIWLVIWGLQGKLFFDTAGSEFWTNPITAFFCLVCIGNIGSQVVGAKNLGWLPYISLIVCMLVSSVLLMIAAMPFYSQFPIAIPATQLYVGWASLAFVVGTGVIVVSQKEIISDRLYTILGGAVLAIVPAVIWGLWFTGGTDLRAVTIPYFILYFAFGLRAISSGGNAPAAHHHT